MKLFDRNFSVEIHTEEACDLAVTLAAKDLQRDLRRISGQTEGFPLVQGGKGGIVIRTVEGSEPEAYTVTVSEKEISVTGTDVLGTVFGIYALSTRCLNVLPTHRFIDLFPETKEEMEAEEESFSSPKRTVRFRGWFINDEDLLNEWKDSGYRRDLDYRYYNCVMHPEVMDAVIETALRLEYNLIIPATLLDIDRPGEEKLVELAYNRGMFISQHHIEPMGTSHFAAERYFASRGREEELSFASNPKALEELWLHYATRWSKYAKQVVWQLGLRGKRTKPFGKTTPPFPPLGRAEGSS